MGKARRKVKSGDKRKQAPEPRKLKKQRSGTVWHNNARSEDDDNYTDNFNRSDVNDEVDQFFDERDKVSLDRYHNLEPADSSSEEEVLPLVSDEEDSDPEVEMYKKQLRRLRAEGIKAKLSSDAEDNEDDDNDDDDDDDEQKAWGHTRQGFYGGNVDEMKQINYSDEDVDAAVMEEREALEVQKRLAAEMRDDDFGLDIFQSLKKATIDGPVDKDKVKVARDLSSMTKKEKMALLKKESPELLELIDDYKLKLKEVNERLIPISDMVKTKQLPRSACVDYVDTRLQLCLSYCLNITFYLALKAKRVPIDGHPVIERIVQYRKLLKQLDDVGQKVEPHIEEFLQLVKAGRLDRLLVAKEVSTKKAPEKQAPQSSESEDEGDEDDMEDEYVEDEEEEKEAGGGGGGGGRNKRKRVERNRQDEADEDYNMDENTGKIEEDGEAVNGDADIRRGITYDIAKNKGLTARKKKEYRNPRVKHRLKFRKAKIRRRGQVREVRTELSKYGGEISGIRAGVIKSTRLK